MATSSLFKKFVVRPEDEEAWVRAFDPNKKVNWEKDVEYKVLTKEEAFEMLENRKESTF